MRVNLAQLRPGPIVVMPLFTCNVSCQHCQHACSPVRRERMPFDLFQSVVHQALETNCTSLCLSGGEPFLLPSYIAAASEACRRTGRLLIIQTNGFWGGRGSKIGDLLKKLSGTAQIGFSIDSSHLREIPLERVLGAMKNCLEAGVTRLSVTVAYASEEEFSVLKEQLAHRFRGLTVVGWPIAPIGRAALHRHLWAGVPAYNWHCLQRGCSAQLEFSPVVHPDGKVHFCYHCVMALEGYDPLIIGNVYEQSLKTIFEETDNRMALLVLSLGGGGIGYLLRESPYSYLLERTYQSVCHFCYEVFSRPEVVGFVRDLLETGVFDDRLREGVNQSTAHVPPAKKNKRILACSGPYCAQKNQNYPVIHYLLNRLSETGLCRVVDVEVVNCLGACGEGPNLRMEDEDDVIRHVTLQQVDALITRISEASVLQMSASAL